MTSISTARSGARPFGASDGLEIRLRVHGRPWLLVLGVICLIGVTGAGAGHAVVGWIVIAGVALARLPDRA